MLTPIYAKRGWASLLSVRQTFPALIWRAQTCTVHSCKTRIYLAPTLRETILSDTNLSGANLSRADLRDADFTYAEFGAADLSDALIRNANLSGARFRRTAQAHASEPQVPGTHFAKLTQSQLDEAIADSFNPPIIDEGIVDYATGKQLVWRGAAIDS